MPAPPAVAVRGLTKTYGPVTALSEVSLEVPAGAVCALLGPNGAGKTTLVECLEGFRVPDRGAVRVLGLDPRRERDRLLPRLGVLLQEGGTYKAATPRELLDLYARLYPAPADPGELLSRLDLEAVAGRRMRTLSGGQQQRVALALALVGRPELLILDEPTAGMDPQARRDTWALLGELRGAGATVLFSTHLLEEVERHADLVAVLHQGRLRAFATPAALTAGDAGGLLVTTPADDLPRVARDLSAALGHEVTVTGPGRLTLAAPADAIPAVTAWFAQRGLALSGVTTATHDLEDAVLRLTESP